MDELASTVVFLLMLIVSGIAWVALFAYAVRLSYDLFGFAGAVVFSVIAALLGVILYTALIALVAGVIQDIGFFK